MKTDKYMMTDNIYTKLTGKPITKSKNHTHNTICFVDDSSNIISFRDLLLEGYYKINKVFKDLLSYYVI